MFNKRKREELEAAREIEKSCVGVISVIKDSHEFKKFEKVFDHFTNKKTEAKDDQDTEAAAAANDDEGHLFDLYKVCERKKSADPRKKLPNGTDPRSFLMIEPELVAVKATDLSTLAEKSRLRINFCGHSANTTFWFAQAAEEYRDLLARVYYKNTEYQTPTVTFRIDITHLTSIKTNKKVDKENKAPDSFQRGIFMSDCRDDAAMERMISIGNSIKRLRKAIYEMDPTDVKYGNSKFNSSVKYTPALSGNKVQKLIEEHVSDDETRDHLLNHLHGDDERVSGAIRMGFIFSTAFAEVLAWWLALVEQVGFGCSHTPDNFNRTRMDAFLNSMRSDTRREWLCRFVLAWACCDGRIGKYFFNVIVAAHTEESLGDSIGEFMDDVCKEIFGKDVYFSKSKPVRQKPNGKTIVTMQAESKEALRTIRRVLEPYVEDYMPRWKLANLLAY